MIFPTKRKLITLFLCVLLSSSCQCSVYHDTTGRPVECDSGLLGMQSDTIVTTPPTVMPITTAKSIGPITWDDATWILTSSFIIFTMQSGFGLLEAGCVSRRNEVNIMVKNAVDVVFGGVSYWIFGFGLSFGKEAGSNSFNGVGLFFVDTEDETMGLLYSTYVFQLSFATTATTIVSGAMAERTKLLTYIIFSFLNTIVYCIPAHWEWAEKGFLRNLGVVDIAGSGAVHLVGGVSALVATILLKPRLGRFDPSLPPGTNPLPMGNPANVLIGMFMLWWGWLAFNCGSTFGISGGKWKLAAKAAVTTLNGSMGGGVAGIIISYIFKRRTFDVTYLTNSILGALVGITAGCAIVRPYEALIIGVIGAIVALACTELIEKLKIDDPVGAVAVHGASGIWGMLSVGLFARYEPIENTTNGRSGLFHGGGLYLFGIQLLACVVIIAWSAVVSLIILLALKFTFGLRMSEEDEKAGADWAEHRIGIGPDTKIYGSTDHDSSSVASYNSRRGSALSRTSIKSDISDISDVNDTANFVFSRFGKRHKIKQDKVLPISIPCPNNQPNKLNSREISIASFI